MKKVLAVCLLLLCLLPQSLYAACSWTGNTGTVASPYAVDDVQACLTDAASKTGAVIISIPAATPTWSSAVSIDKTGWTNVTDLTIQGAGVASTVITGSGTLTNGFFYVNGFADPTNLLRITGIGFVNSGTTQYTAIKTSSTGTGKTKIRIDHCSFTEGAYQITAYGVKGVIDSNTFINANIAVDTGESTRAQQDADWTSLAASSTDAANFLFIEGNTFTDDADYPFAYFQERVSGSCGGKYVVRYNTFDGTGIPAGLYDTSWLPIMWHGSSQGYWQLDSGACRAPSVIEIYNNYATGKRVPQFVAIRGSANLIHHNSVVSATYTPRITLDEEEFHAYPSEQSNWDPARTERPAEDQVFNSFFWSNIANGVAMEDDTHVEVVNVSTSLIVKNQDYFLHAPQDSGGSESFSIANGASNTAPTNGLDNGTMSFTATGANAYYPYSTYTCPHPLTSLSGSCDSGGYGVASYNITPDTTAPTVSAFTIPETASALTIAVSSFECSDAVGVTGYCANESSEAPTAASCSGSGWAGSAQTGYTFGTAGAKTLYGWCKDSAGNISTSATDTITVTLITSNNSVATRAAGGTGSATLGTGTGSMRLQQ